MTDANSFERVMSVHAMLKRGDRVSATLLARSFEISERQVYRVLDFLRDRLRAPVAYDRARRTYYYQEATFELPSAFLTKREVLALLHSHKLLEMMHISPFFDVFSVAACKVRDSLDVTASGELAGVLCAVSTGPRFGKHIYPVFLDYFVRALNERRTLHIRYRSAFSDEVSELLIDVYHLVCDN